MKIKAITLIMTIMQSIMCYSQADTIHLSLDECITLARSQSVDASVALGELNSSYWEYRSYKANMLPEVSFNASLPTFNRSYGTYQNNDGSYSYVRNDNMGLDGGLSITQKIIPTGGTVSVHTSLNYLRQLSGNNTDTRNQFMSIPIAITLSQPIFGTNHLKWSKKIDPLRYKSALANYISKSETVAMKAIDRFFNLLIANEKVKTEALNLQNAEKLYDIAIAKRKMGQISENDVLQMRLNTLTARSSLTSSESYQKACMFELCSFLGIESAIIPILPDKIPEVILDYQTVLHHALENNSFATDIRLQQLNADYSVASAKGAMRSITLYAQIGYTGSGTTLSQAYHGLQSNDIVSIGVSLPILDWGKRKGNVKVAESNREIARNQIRQETQQFNQSLFILTEQFNNQKRQLHIAEEADAIAQKRYHTNVETFKIGTISTLELNDAQSVKDNAQSNRISQLRDYWYYYYQIRSITLWDFEKDSPLTIKQ